MSGSTKVILKSSFLRTLRNGNHNISIVSTDGTAKTNFVIPRSYKPSPAPDPVTPYAVPNTGVK